ncbi:DUF397 domain-containing protein [Streptomyces hypolithicus]
MTDHRTEPATSNLLWFKSSYSTGGGGECVEVAVGADAVHVRDSKVLTGPALALSSQAWVGFVGLACEQPVRP